MPKSGKRKASAEPSVPSDLELSFEEWKKLNQRTLALKCGQYKLGAKGNKTALAERLHKWLHPELYPPNNENADPNLGQGTSSSQPGAVPVGPGQQGTHNLLQQTLTTQQFNLPQLSFVPSIVTSAPSQQTQTNQQLNSQQLSFVPATVTSGGPVPPAVLNQQNLPQLPTKEIRQFYVHVNKSEIFAKFTEMIFKMYSPKIHHTM